MPKPASDMPERQRSWVNKRTVSISGHHTSVNLEDAFWKALKEIAASKGVRASQLVATIESERQSDNLSSAIRLFVLNYYRGQSRNPSVL